MYRDRHIAVIGAGPAGLVAAINLAKAGFPVRVYERAPEVGSRFHGDFQGIENWSSERDALTFLNDLNIAVNFDCTPFSAGLIYADDFRRRTISSDRPYFYLIRRGKEQGSLDQGLKRQAEEYGVIIQTNTNVEHIQERPAVISIGPKKANVIAAGYIFDTDRENLACTILSNRVAPSGYSYLLVINGSATLATCLFEDFHRANYYRDETLKAFQDLLGIKVANPKKFGGYGNFSIPTTAHLNGRIYVGESVGFQDFLWGFGLRCAMQSGYLAAQSIITGTSYDALWKNHLLPQLKTSIVNRYIYRWLGKKGYVFLADKMEQSGNSWNFLHKSLRPSWFKRIIYPWAASRFQKLFLEPHSCKHECDCVWCQCVKEGEINQ